MSSYVTFRVWHIGFNGPWFQFVLTHQAKNWGSRGLTNNACRISLHWSESLPNTEPEEEKKSSRKKKTDFRTWVWWAHYWRWGYGTNTQYSPLQGLVAYSAASKCCTLPSSELFLARGPIVFVLQCVSSCLLLFSVISPLLPACSFQKSEEK